MWHVSSRSGVETLRTGIHLLLTYLLTSAVGLQNVSSRDINAGVRIVRTPAGRTDIFQIRIEFDRSARGVCAGARCRCPHIPPPDICSPGYDYGFRVGVRV